MTGTPTRTPPVLAIYRRLERLPAGHRVFSTAVAWRAPYFRGIRPRFLSLAPGRGEVAMRNRWSVRNHLGTVHAIACCNLVEIAAGVTTEVTVPPGHRWIPTGMDVAYLAKATTDLRAVAVVPDLTDLAADENRDLVVPVDVTDTAGTLVVHADVTMRLSPRSR
ncbi:Acyl-coenzyme A thioesterase PaaI, contains HGG motif [Klenkia marina]|uniref:Acyl-coenzyme A thioesterase PaaI, contains HGG motif n=1 Tax=Klenkia marina TaxID=1960309 RepID=A0A1G4YL75_9ACTN|nr:hotdog fold domain-containing protein [Klenkia marina]SCX54144.1 Acyl-coenzyme A thioesterase PaaI, contains HGG motif [Klenkia marina]